MALYREGKASLAADGTVTGTGTKWQSSLSLIRPGATIMFLSSPIQMAVVNKVVSDTEIKAITTNGAVVASTDYAILLSDSLTVDGLAQDVAETLRYYQSQETAIADAVDSFKDFDFELFKNLANQAKADSEAANVSAANAAESESAAKTSETNSKTSEANAKISENAAKTSEIAAENARDAAVAAQQESENAAAESKNYALQASEVGNMFSDEAAGLAATSNGQFFQVPQGSGSFVSFKLFKNNNGVAEEVARVPGAAAITGTIREFPTLAAAQADADAGNIPTGSTAYYRSADDATLAIEVINNAGTLEPTGRKMPSQESIEPLINLLKLVTYVSDDEYEGSGVDSAGMDSAGRWLWKWIADVLWLKNLVVTGDLTAAKAEVEEIEAGQVTINGVPVKSVDNVDYLNSDEYAGAKFDSAIVSENLRWLMGWVGDRAYFKNVTLGSLLANIIDVESLTIAGVPYQSYLVDASEFEGSELVSGVLDSNNRIISGLAGDGEEYPKKGDGKFRAFVDDTNLKVLNIETSSMEVFATGTDFTNVRNEYDHFIFNSPSSDAVAGEIMCPYNAWLPVSEYGRKTIALWGHSFIGNNTSFSLKLSQLTGYPAYNFGRSGATSVSIALRNGAYTKSYQPTGGVIPASGDVTLTPAAPGPLQIVGDVAAKDNLKCSLAGVDGVVNWTGTEMVFTRSEAGSEVSVTELTPLIVYPYTTREVGDIPLATQYYQHRESVNILWIGRNNASSIMQILSDMKAITDKLTRQNRRFVVLPEFPMASEIIGTTGQAQIMYLNSELKRLYPGNYCEIDGVDLLQNFKNHYNPAYAQDVTDVANGVTPTSLRQDTLHPSQSLRPNALYIGTEVNANFVYQFMVSKGWL